MLSGRWLVAKKEMTMKKWIIGLGAAIVIAGVALAQVPGAIKITSLVGAFSVNIATSGPQSAILPINGGTATCTGGGTITVANTAVDAGSIIVLTLKTVGGTPAQPFLATITPATGFTFTCGGSDTSIYNYIIIG